MGDIAEVVLLEAHFALKPESMTRTFPESQRNIISLMNYFQQRDFLPGRESPVFTMNGKDASYMKIQI